MKRMSDMFWNGVEFVIGRALCFAMMLNEYQDRWKFKKEREK